MFEKTIGFFHGLVQLAQNPLILGEYQKSVDYLKEIYDSDVHRLEGQNAELSTELRFHILMEQANVTIGQVYFDRRPDHGFITIHNFENQIVYTDSGEVPGNDFLHQLALGTLVPLSPAQVNGDASLPPTQQELIESMQQLGFQFAPNPAVDMVLWEPQSSGPTFDLLSWTNVEDVVAHADQYAGVLIYPSGEAVFYPDKNQYISSYDKELDDMGPTGVYAVTLSKDPAVHKSIDDLRYGAFGEENPHSISYYQEPEVANRGSEVPQDYKRQPAHPHPMSERLAAAQMEADRRAEARPEPPAPSHDRGRD